MYAIRSYYAHHGIDPAFQEDGQYVRDALARLKLANEPVLGHGRHNGGFNNFRVNRHLYGFQHVPAGKVNGSSPIKRQA